MQLTAAHWVYLAGVVVILATMVLRKNIVVPAVAATFLTALVFSGSLTTALSAIFNASLVAAVNLFNIFLIIALVTAMLGALKAIGADHKMVTPFRPIMRNGHIAFWVLAGVTYLISLFFWPTPAVPLIGAVLIPVAIRAGLSPMGVGLVVAISGQGMALSSDYIIRVAPGLSATAAGADADVVADRALVLSLIVGVVALVIAYSTERRRLRQPSDALLVQWESAGVTSDARGASASADPTSRADGSSAVRAGDGGGAGTVATATKADAPAESILEPSHRRWGTVFAVVVPLAYLALVTYMVVAKASDSVPDLRGGDAAALVGGVATLLLFLAALAKGGRKSLETSAGFVVDGLVFAFKAMGIVLPIAGFFFIGNGEFAGQILSIGESGAAPNILVDLVNAGQEYIPQSAIVTGFGILVVGVIAGLDGSGFSGLPLTGALAGGLGPAVNVDAETLAAIGQMGNIWSGGGTLVAWSSLVAVAGFARVPVIDLARRCFVPVGIGLVIATLFATIVY